MFYWYYIIQLSYFMVICRSVLRVVFLSLYGFLYGFGGLWRDRHPVAAKDQRIARRAFAGTFKGFLIDRQTGYETVQ